MNALTWLAALAHSLVCYAPRAARLRSAACRAIMRHVYRVSADRPPQDPPITMRFFSRPFLVLVFVLACIVAALVLAVSELRGVTLACPRAASPSALTCEVRETRFAVVTTVTPLQASPGDLSLVRREGGDEGPFWVLAHTGWTQEVAEARGRLAVEAYRRFVQSGGEASFELRLAGSPWWAIVLLAALGVTFGLGGRYTSRGNRVVIDVDGDLLCLERRYLLRRPVMTTRQLSTIASATIATQDDSNESDVMLSNRRGEPKFFLRAMHYDCDPLVAAIESAAARARMLRGMKEGA